MASYDESRGNSEGGRGSWVLSQGDYLFSIGNGVHEAMNGILAYKTGGAASLTKAVDDESPNADNVSTFTLDREDATTYSQGVSNRLQDADLNNLIDGSVEYTTRSDWTKGWEPVESITPTDDMMQGLTNSRHELTENGDGTVWEQESGLTIANMIQTDDDGNFAGVLPLDDPQWDRLIDGMSLDEAINFTEKQGDGLESIESIALPSGYQPDGPVGTTYDQVPGYAAQWNDADADEPTYVSSSDDKSDWSMTTFQTEPVVAATFDTALVEREGELLGEDSLWSNTYAIQAPGMNLHRNTYNARNHEYFSEDPVLTSAIGMAYSAGGKSRGCIMIAKHLAFNHQEANRAGLSTFFNEQAGRENELRAFQHLLSTNTSMGVMTAFNRVGVDYAGAHDGLINQILRGEWGYEGFIVTDMIDGADYMNWLDVTAVGGGNLLTTSAYETSDIGTMAASKDRIEKDTAFQLSLKSNVKYWAHALAGSSLMNGLTSDTRVVFRYTWWQWCAFAVCGVFAVLCAASMALYARDARGTKRIGKDK